MIVDMIHLHFLIFLPFHIQLCNAFKIYHSDFCHHGGQAVNNLFNLEQGCAVNKFFAALAALGAWNIFNDDAAVAESGYIGSCGSSQAAFA